jgi:ubiquinone/menaquinone biosynthesis C-methylase UbiE
MNNEIAAADLPFTGERFIPGTRGEIWIEHWHRYHFASRWSAGRRVLDIACGEGYGSALLARNAGHVTGVDVSLEAVEHARLAYSALRNAEFRQGSCTRIPLPDASVELVVSFETIEHIEEQDAFVDEIARVLAPDGVVLMSCPNKAEYTDKRGFRNEFHVKELYRAELEALLRTRFAHSDWYGQRPTFYSIIAPERAVPWAGQLVEVTEQQPDVASNRLSDPLYFIIAAARERAPLLQVGPALSVFADRSDWMYQDYVGVIRDLRHHAALNKELEAKLAERDAQIGQMRNRPWWLRWLGR